MSAPMTSPLPDAPTRGGGKYRSASEGRRPLVCGRLRIGQHALDIGAKLRIGRQRLTDRESQRGHRIFVLWIVHRIGQWPRQRLPLLVSGEDVLQQAPSQGCCCVGGAVYRLIQDRAPVSPDSSKDIHHQLLRQSCKLDHCATPPVTALWPSSDLAVGFLVCSA